MLTLGALPELRAASGAWQANPSDQGVNIAVTGDGSAWTVSPNLVEGDVVYVGATTGVNLGTDRSYYYVVGVGSTSNNFVRFSTSPGSVTFSSNGTNSPLTVAKVPTWGTVGNWAAGVVPNGVDDQATIVTDASLSAIALDRDITFGTLTVDTTVSGANGLSLIGTTRMGGPLSTLTLQRSTGTPSITLSGGNSFTLSESKISGAVPANSGARLVVVGTQGLVIDNQNPVTTPVAVNSGSVLTPPVNTPTFGSGQFRFGFGLDWSKFSGDLVLTRGVFQPLAGGSLNNNLSAFPLASKLVLGTGSNVARLEIPSNSGNNPGSLLVRGLESTSPNSSIINTSLVVNTTTPPTLSPATIEVGSYGLPTDSYTYAGNIGDNADIGTIASVSALRFAKIGPGTQILSGLNEMDGFPTNTILVVVHGGKLSLATTGAIGTITNGQGAASANSSFVLKNGEFALSGLGVAVPRSQSFGGSLIQGTVSASATFADANQSSQSSGFSTLTVTADPAQPATLTFGALKPRNFKNSDTSNLNGTTMLFRGTNLGAAPGAGVASILFTTAPTSGGGNLFALGGDGPGTVQAPVLKGALADTSPTGHGTGFATYDSTTGVRLLSGAEQQVVTTGGDYNSAPNNNNVLLDLSADAAITGHLTNTLQVRNLSGSSRTVTNTGTDLNASAGFLFSGTDPVVLTGGQITGTAMSDGEDVVIHSINSSAAGVTIQSPIANFPNPGTRQGWVTYSGTGNFRLEGTHTLGWVGENTGSSSFGGIAFNSTGTTTFAAPIVNITSFSINQGIVKLDTGASWTTTPRLLVAPEGKFDLNGIGGTSTLNRFTDISPALIGNSSGALALNMGGEVTNSSGTTVDLRLSTTTNGATNSPYTGTITGNLNLVVDKWNFNSSNTTFTYGTQSIANVNTYTGETRVLGGILNVARGGLLPATTVVTLGSVTGNLDTNGRDVVATLSLGDSNGSTNGSVRQTIAGLNAIGTASAVINNGSNISQLTLNIASGENVYTGNLGIALTTNGSNSNSFGLRKTGPGVFEPAGAVNTYSGGTIIEGGILRVSADAKLGQIGSLTGVAGSASAPVAPISAFANSLVLNGGTLQVTTTTPFVLDAKRGIGLGPVNGSTGGTGTLWVNSGISLTYGGIIASAGNTGSQTLVKNGSGHLSLNGASTFTGLTQVVAGSLGGTGSLASNVTVESGGAIAPGDGAIGTFTVNGALTFNAGAVLNMELGAPGTSDKIQLGGGAVSATGTTTINLAGLTGFGVGSYTLISGAATSFSTGNFVVGAVPSGYHGTLSASGGTLTVTIAEGSPLAGIETWRQTHFGTPANAGNAADTADPDGDGLPNLVEYATGTNPLAFGASAVVVDRSGNFLTLTYTRIADATLTYTVEGSSDLAGAWATVAAGNNPSTGVQNTAGPVTVTDTVSVLDAPGRRFLRLKVSH